MATFDYNPITGNLDLVGSGASYINGVVADPTALPVTVGTPPLDSVYLAKAGSGVWLINRKPAGLYCRVANNGNAADWAHLGAFPEVNADGNWELYNSTDPTKELKFDLSGLPTATTRTVNAPDGNGKMLVEGQSIGATTRASGAFTTLNANNGTLTASAPVLDLSQTWNNAAVTFTGLRFNVTDTSSGTASRLVDLQVGGTSRFRVEKNGGIFVGVAGAQTMLQPTENFVSVDVRGGGGSGAAGIRFAGSASGISTMNFWAIGGGYVFNTSASLSSGTGFQLWAEANEICAQRNGTNAQTFRLYNTFTDASNYERAKIAWSSNVLQIGTEKGGTGSARALEFQTDGTTRLTLASTGNAVFAQASVVGATWYFGHQNRSIFKSPSDGVLTLMNWAETDFGRIQLGGTTSSFPALKRSSTTLQVRLADDSAFAPLVASEIGIGVTPERPLHIQGSAAFGRMDRQGSNGPAWLMIRMATGTTVSSSWLFGPATGVASVANDDFSIIDYGTSTSGTSGTQRLTIAKSDGQLTVNGNLNLSTKNLVTDTTTGTRIGTGTTQLLGFWNAAPSAQPAAVADATDAASTQARLNDLLARLRTIGIIAA